MIASLCERRSHSEVQKVRKIVADRQAQKRLESMRAQQQREALLIELAKQPKVQLKGPVLDLITSIYMQARSWQAIVRGYEYKVRLAGQAAALSSFTLAVRLPGQSRQQIEVTPTHVEPFRVGNGTDQVTHCYVYFRLELV